MTHSLSCNSWHKAQTRSSLSTGQAPRVSPQSPHDDRRRPPDPSRPVRERPRIRSCETALGRGPSHGGRAAACGATPRRAASVLSSTNRGVRSTVSWATPLDRESGGNTESPVDIAHEMRRLTLSIAGETLFGTDLADVAADIDTAVVSAIPPMDGLHIARGVASPRPDCAAPTRHDRRRCRRATTSVRQRAR